MVTKHTLFDASQVITEAVTIRHEAWEHQMADDNLDLSSHTSFL